MPNTSESDFLVKVPGVDGLFATCTGGGTPADSSQAFNGGDDFPTPVMGKVKPQNITVTRPYKPERDAQLVKELRRRIRSFKTSVSKQPLLPDGTPIGDPTVYVNSTLLDVMDPEYNAGSSNPGVMQLIFIPERVI